MISKGILKRLLALHPREIDLSLDRLQRLLEDLGHPERALPPIIHVAGTNGKGSTIALMRAALEAAQKRVHVYTSPHLVHFHERIRLAGSLITEQALQGVLDDIEQANAGQDITFFEATTAAAFLAFSRTPADVLLLEVGLGGRLDATNVIESPLVSVITPVAQDHERFLGSDLGGIAREKAGILKPQIPAISAPQDPAALQAITAQAQSVGAKLHVIDTAECAAAPPTNMVGTHQSVNSAVAAAALRESGLVAEDHIRQGFMMADWPGRLQNVPRGPLFKTLSDRTEIWLDGGHNPHAGQALADFLAGQQAKHPLPLHLITGMLDTKASDGFLQALADAKPIIWTVRIPDTDASRSPEDVAEIARSLGLTATPCTSVMEAVKAVPTRDPVRLLIAGSLYLAGHVLAENDMRVV